jgi:hypothetical protein
MAFSYSCDQRELTVTLAHVHLNRRMGGSNSGATPARLAGRPSA